ncbi:MAG: glycosyltransferase [Egibacteraceae bacterium]
MQPTLRSLYICYLSLEDPLVHTQVVAYLAGLARGGHKIHLLTFDPELSRRRRRDLRNDLDRRGIAWHSLRYHKRPSLPATIYDALAGATMAMRIVRAHGLDAIHARNHVPAAMALIVRRLTGCGLIFDIRGLMAEEYVDAGRWRRGGIPYRITDAIQKAAIRRADAVVMLTERARRELFGPNPPARTQVIPCCADVDRLREGSAEEEGIRKQLSLEDRPVMAYVGKLSGRYMTREMVAFFAAARELQPSLVLLVLTQESPEIVLEELTRTGISKNDYRVTRAEPQNIGLYLSTATFALYFYRPTFSEIAASPTKVGEYLGAGLPIVSGPGVGDTDELLRENDVGVVVEDFSPHGYEAAARQIAGLASDPACRQRCRTVAQENLSLERVGVPRYDEVYRGVAEAIGPRGASKP